MKHSFSILLPVAAICSLTLSSYGGVQVDNTWQDGTRTDPVPPVYSENGVDADADNDIESAHFGTTLSVPSPGILRGTVGNGSSSWTTYFATPGAPLTLVNPGDSLSVRWDFSMTGLNAANGNQGFRLALVNSAGSTPLISDGTPGTGPHLGYAMFMNIAPTLGNGNSFQLLERNAVTSDLLSTGGNWAGRANGATTGDPGYAAATPYSYLMTMTLDLNIPGQLNIVSTMTGAGLGPGGQGFLTTSYSDLSPSTLSFDMFAWRPATSTASATTFDTTRFRVEYSVVPEPSVFALVGAGLLGLACAYRRVRR